MPPPVQGRFRLGWLIPAEQKPAGPERPVRFLPSRQQVVDVILALSIFSHASQAQVRACLALAAKALRDDGVFLCTYYAGESSYAGEAWVYPGHVQYRPDDLAGIVPDDATAGPVPALAIRQGREIARVPLASIDWIDAAGDYMCVHAAGQTYILRGTMKSLEDALDPATFQRVHRSTIVNLGRVERMRPHMNGEFFLILAGGHEIKLSRTYRDKLDHFLRAGRVH